MQIDPDTAKSISSDDVVVTTIPSYKFLYVALSPGAKEAPTLTPDVRQAIALALDYDGIIAFTVGGAGKKIAATIPHGPRSEERRRGQECVSTGRSRRPQDQSKKQKNLK